MIFYLWSPPMNWTTTLDTPSPSNGARQDGAGSAARRRCAALRHELLSPELSFLMEAHNGLSAKVVDEAGFAGIWASGLSMSAALGVRDCNEASWTQALEILD